MKVLFVVKTIDFIDPHGIMLLSAIAKKAGHKTFLGVITRENIYDKIDRIKPDIIAYSASTGEHKYYCSINPSIKKKFDVFTIIGGPHITFYPDSFFLGKFDAACIGEGDEAFPELLNNLSEDRNIDNIHNIKVGKKNPFLRPLVQDLNSFPFPDRDIFYKNTEMGNFPIKSFITGRGCPYPCTYCFNYSFKEMYRGKGKFLRRVKVDYIIDEISRVKSQYPLQFIKFYDDIFAFPKDSWLKEFVEKYKSKINIPFHCATRPDLVNEDMVKLLKEGGCFSVNMSIEAGNADFRNKLLKRNIEEEAIVKAFHMFHKYSIKIFSNSILGLPYSNIEHDIETLNLNLKCKVQFAEFPVYHPYPKTELGEYCIKKRIFDGDFDSLHMSYQNKSPLSCFSEKQKKLQKNLSLLSAMIICFHWTRRLVLNCLIHIRPNIVFFWIYLLFKIYLVKTKIYPFHSSAGEIFNLFKKSFSVDYFKHSDEEFSRS